MKVIEIENGITGYRTLVDYVVENGTRRAPRGVMTRDVGPVTVVMRDINYALPLGIGRNVNRRIAAAEAVQLIGSFSIPRLLINATPNFANYAEPDGHFHGAYGNRIKGQLSHVVNKLMKDVHTRQAMITLWDPWLDNLPNKRDYPCTISLHFALIDATLELTVLMRSQDVWLGTPFDWGQFTQLQHTVARLLNAQPGVYRHITLSTHIYETNLEAASKLTDPPPHNEWEWQPAGIGQRGDTVEQVITQARRLAGYNGTTQPEDLTLSERWYADQLKPLLHD